MTSASLTCRIIRPASLFASPPACPHSSQKQNTARLPACHHTRLVTRLVTRLGVMLFFCTLLTGSLDIRHAHVMSRDDLTKSSCALCSAGHAHRVLLAVYGQAIIFDILSNLIRSFSALSLGTFKPNCNVRVVVRVRVNSSFPITINIVHFNC